MIRGDIRSLTAYQVPDSRGMIKLDAMENPYPLPDSLRGKWAKRLAKAEINRYPDADARELRQMIAEQDGLSAENVLLGNGSDEIIQMLLMAADNSACVIPQPTFTMYELISRWLKRPVASVPLEKDFTLNAEGFVRVCAREKASIAFLSCPNNPTGNMWSRSTVAQVAESFRGILVIDEAYRPFADDTYVDMLAPNVLILRTFSKLGMAGLRLGYLLGHPDTIAHLNKVRLPYNINTLTQLSTRFFLEHFDLFEEQAKQIRAERKRVSRALMGIDGITVFPSQANFLLFRVKGADDLFEKLRDKKILIKNMNPQGGLLKECLRVTIGLPEENAAFLQALEEILA
ncbi:MAG TPA: histidinol-phosphate transaminase [Mariprofundaceae bacterium]|nr:histidinol-phosphate transaminase [Mariprofundaceae bacterium]